MNPALPRASLLAVLFLACSSTTPEASPNAPAPTTPASATPDAGDVPDGGDVGAEAGKAPPSTPFRDGPYGTTPKSTAGPFTVPTTAGDWSFRDEWTGDDHYVFLVYAPGVLVYQNKTDFSAGLFKKSIGPLLAASPKNVHYFFLWLKDQPGFDAFRGRAEKDLASLPEWSNRVHFVTTQVDKVEGWVGDLVRERIKATLPYKQFDPLQWAIDRTQRVREVGMLGRLAQGGISPDLTFLASEPKYYEFEFLREQKLKGDNAKVVELFKEKTVVDEAFADVTLPSASDMESFDTLEADLTTDCEHHRDGECGAWDYLSHLHLCEEVGPSTAADAGAGPDGGGGPTLKCETELARWITSYWREGRWVTDISQVLPFLQRGGRHHFRWYASRQWDPRPANYVASLSLRFSNKGRGMRPVEVTKLFEGGPLNATYNAKYTPRQLTVPAGVKKAEIYALVTGHGSETGQCAEFCNHTHHFAANGAPHEIAFPEAQSLDGCREKVSEGVVPNQHGTWYYGRGGWCPGLDVRPHVLDITPDLRVGSENQLTYEARVGADLPAADTSYGNIVLTSYLVYWK